MPEIDFQVNEFRVYKVNVDGVSFGFIDTGAGGYVPAKGEQFEYDGNTVILKDGRQFTDVPQLRSAIKGGWCVPVGDKVTRYQPKSANIQVRPTETRGNERPTKVSVETTPAEEREVVSVAERRRRREATNETAARNVPLESAEGRAAVASATGDDDLDEIISAIDGEMQVWTHEQEEEVRRQQEAEQAVEDAKAQAEADILAMLNSVDDDHGLEEEAGVKEAPPTPAPRRTARGLPVDAEDERVVMPIVREDPADSGGTVVGKVGEQPRTIVERENEIELNVAPARPETESPKPKPRFGGAGAIVVDEQRDMGQISLSGGTQAPIRLDESAKVQPGNTESIRMGDAQVGRRKTARQVETAQGQEGVAVGRVLSPTHQTFEASDSNTSSTAIQRTQEGKQLRVERFETDDEVVGKVGDAPKAAAVATGDVQEATAGDTLEEVLPDAATGPTPEVHRRPEEDPAYAAVKMMVPDFEWDKDRPVKERVASAMKHIENPMYIKGILAVETQLARDEIKKALASELESRSKKGKKTPKKRAKKGK